MSRRALATVLALTLVAAAGGWFLWDRTHPSYCEVVADRQDDLTELGAASGPGATFAALEHYRDLQAAAPDDVADEWAVVVDRMAALEEALRDAGVDPATYDPERDREELDRSERSRVEEAAGALADPATREAMAALEQQALDVCHTPLAR